MSRTVILSFGKGDLNNGFPEVTAQVWYANSSSQMRFKGRLLAKPEIFNCYNFWHSLYIDFYRNRSWRSRSVVDDDIELNDGDITNISFISVHDFDTISCELKENINDWLNSTSFFTINNQLRTELDTKEEIQFILETEDEILQKLPWHFWNFFEDYSQAEIALNTSDEYKRKQKITTAKKINKVKILVILGNSEGINTEDDKALIEKLEDAEPQFLVEPKLSELNNTLWQQGWDILFFAGHSSSQEKGKICINKTDSLTIDELKYGLKKAIERGLKLAIFNSCDGLGLARDLADLHIPQIIVMRELVPDMVAQTFLKHFLEKFSNGQSLYTSVRDAREQLQGEENNFPCATWLPIICQNPAEVSLTWEELRNGVRRDSQVPLPNNIPSIKAIPEKDRVHPQPRGIWHRLQVVFCTSVVVAGLVMGVRSQRILQALELPAYDMMMRMLPQEEPDDSLILITITGEDLQLPEQQERKAGLSDQALDMLLKKLEPHKPRVIGLDILRDFNVNPKYKNLATRMRQDGFIGICYMGAGTPNNPGSPKPPEVPIEQVGFSDVLTDKPYDIIRRHLLHAELRPTTRCGATEVSSLDAFSLKIALRYLEKKDIRPKFTSPPEQYLQLGNVVFKELETHSGGYQKLNASGHQILLRYRSVNGSPLNITDYKFTLKQVLRDEVNLNFIKDKIVLIGVDAPTIKDFFLTPYTQGQEEVMPGVIVQAQMVSQIVSAVLDGRSLLTVWSAWNEVLWVWAWSAVGGLLAWLWRSPIKLGLAFAIALSGSYGLCYVFLVQAVWIPFIPSVIALLVTSCSVIIYYIFHNPQSRRT
jgi:CHASE2 domain-containing sensor protein